VRFAWIYSHESDWPIELLCEVLNVTRGGYYDWIRQPDPTPVEQGRAQLLERIHLVHESSRRTYGSPRVTAELNAEGVKVCRNTVAKWMRKSGLRPRRRRKFVPTTTDSSHGFPIAPNRLDRDFAASAPNRKWVCDLTYIWTDQGWLYLAAVMDLYSRRIVGWSMQDHLKTSLTSQALMMAVQARRPYAGLLHHSDRGVQYASEEYQRLLRTHGIVCSMSRTGDCYDNAPAESFFATLKRELINGKRYTTIDQAKADLFEWIEVFYNRQRRHSALGYVSPEAFEAQIN
jgi:transposase InsO family protein